MDEHEYLKGDSTVLESDRGLDARLLLDHVGGLSEGVACRITRRMRLIVEAPRLPPIKRLTASWPNSSSSCRLSTSVFVLSGYGDWCYGDTRLSLATPRIVKSTMIQSSGP